MRKSISIYILLWFVSSCKFKQFNLSDRDIAKHFATKEVKPAYDYLVAENRKLFYAEVNKDKPLPLLVLVHGSPGAWYGFITQLDDTLLQKNFRMIAVDRLGFNKSGKGKAEPSIEAQAEIVAQLIKTKKNNQKVILLGRSYGSPIVAVIAAKYPELIDGLVMVSSGVDPKLEKYFLAGKLAKKGCLFRGCIPSPIVTANDEKDSYAAELYKILPYWKNIKQPVTILQAQDDHIVYPKNGDFLDSVFAQNKRHFLKVPKGGHLLTYTQPLLVREEIMWLRGEVAGK